MDASRVAALMEGLRANEVADRRARGEVNNLPDHSTRSIGEIARANLFTPFNFLLGGLLVVILVVGPLNDALFGGVIIANTLIGIIQEVRAKRTLDRLSVISDPQVTVRRDGATHQVAVNEVVLDDIIELAPGSQVPVDGEVVVSHAIEVDESLLTGESDAVVKEAGDQVLSGSFVAAGSGAFQARRVGADAYASQIAADARRFTLARSELRSGIDLIIKIVGFVMIPTGVLLLVNQIRLNIGIADSVGGTVAGLVAMVPEGLVLLTSIAFAASVVRLGKHNVLVQELPAVETLARVDVVCLDKTGTLTEGDLVLNRIVPGPNVSDADAARALATLALIEESPNSTLRALARGVAPDDVDEIGSPLADSARVTTIRATRQAATPFSSARKWSSATFDGATWVLGAPDVLLRHIADSDALSEAVETYATQGQRVLLLAIADTPPHDNDLPPGLRPYAIALLEDRIRAEAADTLAYFASQDVTVKIISGDHPATVAAVARKCGLDVLGGVDATQIPDGDDEALAATLEANTVFGRVAPRQKRAMVRALQADGHVVAMTGDGVNDVLALKDADIGVAMGSGADATRAAAQLVLLDSNFASLPPVVAEGRQVIANIERVANLFLTKTVYAMLLALSVGVAGLPFPFLPRHLTLVGSLTIGIPAFFLALAPNTTRAEPNFVARVMRFAVPAGLLCASATFGGYYLANLDSSTLTLDQRRTTATLVLVGLGFLILIRLARPLNGWRKLLVATLIGAFALVMIVPFGREFFALSMPSAITFVAVIGIIAVSWWIMELGDRLAQAYRRPYERLQAAQVRTSAREMDRRTERNTAHTVEITGGVGHDPTRALPPQSAPTVQVSVPAADAAPPDPSDPLVPPTVVDDSPG
ncbi:MAG TPA: cation-translocating P-type ATPase [Acidimicrobiales bacterium]|nr:cation-translocating P-type ATPase [Acidimicrobiales bacterium]